jgi:TRAP-type C4-dicarboxylate transport system permease small subunit
MLPLPAWASPALAVQRRRTHIKRKLPIVVALAFLFFIEKFMDSLQRIVDIQTFECSQEM